MSNEKEKSGKFDYIKDSKLFKPKSHSGEQQPVTGGMKNALESILERVKYENRGWLESPTETIDAIMEICFNALASQPPAPEVTRELYQWVKASERLGDFVDSDIPEWKFWHPDHCRVDGRPVDQPFFRKDTERNTVKFSYIEIHPYSRELLQADFHHIEWLEKVEPDWQQLKNQEVEPQQNQDE